MPPSAQDETQRRKPWQLPILLSVIKTKSKNAMLWNLQITWHRMKSRAPGGRHCWCWTKWRRSLQWTRECYFFPVHPQGTCLFWASDHLQSLCNQPVYLLSLLGQVWISLFLDLAPWKCCCDSFHCALLTCTHTPTDVELQNHFFASRAKPCDFHNILFFSVQTMCWHRVLFRYTSHFLLLPAATVAAVWGAVQLN